MANEGKAEQEPSIEEILASIRQIISDDEEAAPAAAEEEPDDVLELTERADKPEPKYEPEPEPEPEYEPEPEPPARRQEIQIDLQESDDVEPVRPARSDDDDSIFTDRAENVTFDAFTELAMKTAIERGSGVTLEQIVREMMRPMVREWLDKNLPKIVERQLQQEMERISKRALDE